jgi:hypothetical protein
MVMKGMTIGWQEEPFHCEFRVEGATGWLVVLDGDEIIAREPVQSAVVACRRARELCSALLWTRAKGA